MEILGLGPGKPSWTGSRVVQRHGRTFLEGSRMTKKITRWLAASLPVVATAGLLFTGSAAAQPSSPPVATGHRVQIREIYYNSPGPDRGGNSSLNAEWVELHNTSGSRI